MYTYRMTKTDFLHDWHGRTCVLATMHKKEQVIAPLLTASLGLDVVVPSDFDTDQFGTFTRDIKRAGNQRDAARKKALAALKQTGQTLAVASEGSFGPHSSIPFLQHNLELVLLIDIKHNLEIAGHYSTTSHIHKHHTTTNPDDVLETAKKWGFPEQGVILRRHAHSHRNIYKDISNLDDLYTTSKTMLTTWFVTSIFMETDMRAHRCPPRMTSIQEATKDLIENCMSRCPNCDAPGFIITITSSGLPCGQCGRPTDQIKSITRSCQICSHQETDAPTNAANADPGLCQWCNP